MKYLASLLLSISWLTTAIVCAENRAPELIPVWTTGEPIPDTYHGLTSTVQGSGNASVANGRMTLSGESKDSRITVSHDFKTAPFPNTVHWKFRQTSESFTGLVTVRIEDSVTGAYLLLARLSADSYAWTYNDNATWVPWRKYFTTAIGEACDTTLTLSQITEDTYQISINGKSVSPALNFKNLRLIDQTSLTVQAKGELEILSAFATADSTGKATDLHSRKIDISLLPASTPIKSTNPNANGYQIAYFERGFSDGMTDPERRDEFIARLRELHVSSLRFPGGTWAYWYNTTSPKSVPALARLENATTVVPYWVKNFSEFRWANDDYFFGICKELNVTAIYQINIATWYDVKTDRAVKLALFDRKLRQGQLAERVVQTKDDKGVAVDLKSDPSVIDPNVDISFMKDATENAAKLARMAKSMGVPVLWEFGNEDYTKFTPETYVRQCKAFYQAIRQVDPQARFAFCGDSNSWTDMTWQLGVLDQLRKNGMTDMADASVHMYLTGGGGGPRDTGAKAYDATLYAWNQLKSMHKGTRRRLDEAGLTNTNISLTEFNVVHVLKNYTGLPLEHSMGRALGEAAIWPDFITRFNHIVFHDLIRNGYGHGTWFCRMYYIPGNPAGSRYVLPLDGKVMSVMHRHATNQILQSDSTHVISQGKDAVLLSLSNIQPFSVSYTLSLKSDRGVAVPPAGWQVLSVPDLSSPDYTAYELPVLLNSNVITVEVPAFSFTYLTLPFKK